MYELSLKPDLADAARRWEAFYAGELIDRPVVCINAPREERERRPARAGGLTYYDKVHGDIGDLLERTLAQAEALWWGGESVPHFSPSFGPDEAAVWVGGRFGWRDESPNTNWSVPFVERWEDVLPLEIRDDNPTWQRLLALYRAAAQKLDGKMLIAPPDLHTNMDLLAAIRGPQQLCLDLIDQPEIVDEAMRSSRALFPKIWSAISEAGSMPERGYVQNIYASDGAAMLQCDFIYMIGPAMFRRWVRPALEEEAATVKHVFFHWDGPGALVHTDDILAMDGLTLLAYVPGAGNKGHAAHVELYRQWQDAGKPVFASGTPEELKAMHRILDPAKVVYGTSARSQAEGEELLKWFVQNT